MYVTHLVVIKDTKERLFRLPYKTSTKERDSLSRQLGVKQQWSMLLTPKKIKVPYVMRINIVGIA